MSALKGAFQRLNLPHTKGKRSVARRLRDHRCPKASSELASPRCGSRWLNLFYS
jgi:hypothetical protein